MKKILLGLTLISAVAIKSNAQEVVVIKQNSKDSTDKPLIVIDGVISENKNMNQIPSTDIKSINVIKGTGATEKYGQKGEKGVVEISTKAKYKTVLDIFEGIPLKLDSVAFSVDSLSISKHPRYTSDLNFTQWLRIE